MDETPRSCNFIYNVVIGVCANSRIHSRRNVQCNDYIYIIPLAGRPPSWKCVYLLPREAAASSPCSLLSGENRKCNLFRTTDIISMFKRKYLLPRLNAKLAACVRSEVFTFSNFCCRISLSPLKMHILKYLKFLIPMQVYSYKSIL